MFAPTTVQIVDRYWSGVLQQSLDTPEVTRTVVQPLPPRPGDREGIGLFLRERLLIVSIPQRRLAAWRQTAAQWSAADVWHPERLRAAIGTEIGAIIGPAFVGYTDTATFRQAPAHGAPTRLLTHLDTAAVADLKQACDPTEWDHGGSEITQDHPSVGVFEGGRLVALAGYEVWGDRIAHICIVTHPQHRGRGHGRVAVGRLTELALQRGLVPQYRTLDANQPSMAIAAALGFERYATTVWCRLRE